MAFLRQCGPTLSWADFITTDSKPKALVLRHCFANPGCGGRTALRCPLWTESREVRDLACSPEASRAVRRSDRPDLRRDSLHSASTQVAPERAAPHVKPFESQRERASHSEIRLPRGFNRIQASSGSPSSLFLAGLCDGVFYRHHLPSERLLCWRCGGAKPCGGQADKRRLTAREDSGLQPAHGAGGQRSARVLAARSGHRNRASRHRSANATALRNKDYQETNGATAFQSVCGSTRSRR
jgi:hypothetical protein